MKLAYFNKAVLSTALAAALVACGSGGGSGSTGTAGGNVSSSGVITGFGSVVVNGVHFDESSANVTINDAGSRAGEHKGLKIGMTVKVKGTSDGAKGAATDIEAEHEVEGKIASIDSVTKTFVVLGQTVYTDDQTLYDSIPNGFNGLTQNMQVEVYGLRDANGIHATLIEAANTGFDEEVRGTVSDLTDANSDGYLDTFKIGGLTIHYDNTTQVEHGTLMNDLKNGAVVEVHLNNMSSNPPHAMKIDFEDSQFVAGEGSRAEVEGYITRVVNSTSFELGNQTVQTSTGTLYDGGLAGDIAVGRKVEAEGTISSGVLIASKIQFE